MKQQFLMMAGVMALALSPLAVWADQCAYVSKVQANDAAHYLPVGGRFVPFCEPCGAKRFPVKHPQLAKTSVAHLLPVSETGLDQDYWELQVNGDGVDLAYIYVRQTDGSFINLAHLAGCPTTGVKRMYDAKGHPTLGLPHLPAPPVR